MKKETNNLAQKRKDKLMSFSIILLKLRIFDSFMRYILYENISIFCMNSGKMTEMHEITETGRF